MLKSNCSLCGWIRHGRFSGRNPGHECGFPSPGSGRDEDDGYILLSAPAKLCVPGGLPSTGQPGRQHPGKRGGVTRVSCFWTQKGCLLLFELCSRQKTGSWEGPFVFQPVFHLRKIRNLSLCGYYGKGERVSYLSARQFFRQRILLPVNKVPGGQLLHKYWLLETFAPVRPGIFLRECCPLPVREKMRSGREPFLQRKIVRFWY